MRGFCILPSSSRWGCFCSPPFEKAKSFNSSPLSDMKAESSANNHSTQKVTKMEPVTIGAKHFSRSVYMSGQIINPAENVAGVIIRTGIFNGPGASTISTGTSAATGSGDSTKPFLAYLPSSNFLQLQYPIYLPPGYGLWAKTGSYVDIYITYDLLA